MILSLVLLAQAVKTLPLGTAYAMWTGIGMVLFGESSSVPRLASIGVIVAGVIGLKLVTAE